jgi:hypothetical protein
MHFFEEFRNVEIKVSNLRELCLHHLAVAFFSQRVAQGFFFTTKKEKAETFTVFKRAKI